jgi:hypothetical protein
VETILTVIETGRQQSRNVLPSSPLRSKPALPADLPLRCSSGPNGRYVVVQIRPTGRIPHIDLDLLKPERICPQSQRLAREVPQVPGDVEVGLVRDLYVQLAAKWR